MQFKILTIPATGDHEAEEELNRFLRGHRVISINRELVSNAGTACWCFCIEYLEGTSSSPGKSRGKPRVDYKEVLSEDDFAIFARMRDTRKQLADKEAVPAYAVCTNEQLAEMVKTKAATLADLKKIDGLGDAKAEKYGAALLEALERTEQNSGETSGQTD